MQGPLVATLTAVLVTTSIAVATVLVRTYRRTDTVECRYLVTSFSVWTVHLVGFSAFALLVLRQGVSRTDEIAQVSFSPRLSVVMSLLPSALTVLGVTATVLWLLFVVTYTTDLQAREAAAIRYSSYTVVGLTIAAGLVQTAGVSGLFPLPPELTNAAGAIAVFLMMIGMVGAVTIGLTQLVRTARDYPLLSNRLVVSLAAPIVVPTVTSYLFMFDVLNSYLSVLSFNALGLVLVLGGLYSAVHRYDVFHVYPASRRVGRDTVLDTLDAPVIVLDREGHISDLNRAATSLFDVSSAAVIGSELDSVLPAGTDVEALLEIGSTSLQFPGQDLVLEAQTTVTRSDRGRALGTTIVLNDITDERRQRQRNQVLNRVLRHNLRTEIQVASGFVDALDGADDATVRRIRDQHDAVLQLGEKARRIQGVLEKDPIEATPVPLAAVVQTALTGLPEVEDGPIVSASIPGDLAVTANAEILANVTTELVENALQHAGASHVELWFDEQAATLCVADDGIGVPEHELAVLDAEESSLEHGSGLGLWLVNWGVARLGAELVFDVEDGTVVRIALPDDCVHRDPSTRDGAWTFTTAAGLAGTDPAERAASR